GRATGGARPPPMVRGSRSACRSPATTGRRSRSPPTSFVRWASSRYWSVASRSANTWFPERRSAASTRLPRSARSRPGSGEKRLSGVLFRALRRVVDIRREEVPVVGWCWLFIFSVLSSYYILRPIRAAGGARGGAKNCQGLSPGPLGGLAVWNLPFAWLVKTLPRRRFIPITYHFFAANIVLFALLLHWADAQQTVWIGRIFFIWVSVYN